MKAKRIAFAAIGMISAVATLVPSAAFADSVTGYRDVASGRDWFAPAVQYVSAKKIIMGNKGAFRPNSNLSREEAATILYRNAGNPKTGGNISMYADANRIDSWARDGVAWAAQTGVMTGVGQKGQKNLPFHPDSPLTREQTAKVIALAFHENISHASARRFDSIRGHEKTSPWAHGYMVWATDAGVIHGWPDARGLDPQGATTRGQMAQILANLLRPGDKTTFTVTFTQSGRTLGRRNVRILQAVGSFPRVSTPKGMRFLGWYVGGTKIGPSTPVSRNLTIVARFAAVPKPKPRPWPRPLDQSLARVVLNELLVKGRAPKTGYSRSKFGRAWADTNRNGCDTRDDILNRDLTHKTWRRRTKRNRHQNCIVQTGILHDPYTGKTIFFRRGRRTSLAVQIDHVVALSDAWQTGAQQIGGSNRESFANDPLNLLAVDGRANQQKSDSDAASWLPSNKKFRCPYVARQIAVKKRYHLWVTRAEKNAMTRVLASCPTQRIPR